MTRTRAAAISLAILAAPVAMAQGHQPGGPNGPPPGGPAQDHGGPDHGGPNHGGPPGPGHDGGQDQSHGPPGPGPRDHEWHRGARYTGGRDVVEYHRYHLRRPPHGYEWVRNGGQFVLIGIGTGIIVSVLAANGY